MSFVLNKETEARVDDKDLLMAALFFSSTRTCRSANIN